MEKISVSDGKYTFIMKEGDWKIHVNRYNEPWLVIEQGHKAISSLILRVIELEKALKTSVKLQSHYAKLLNMYDGGERILFSSVEDWLKRLNEVERR